MAFKLTPVNKILVVEREQVQEKQEDRPFILPTKVVLTRHSNVTLKNAGEGSQFERYVGQKMVVVTSMIEEVDVNGEKHLILPENGVVAIIAESDFF